MIDNPEFIICQKSFELGRKSILDAQLKGRQQSNKKQGRPKGSRDKIKHGRDMTNKYKYILFNKKASPFLIDMKELEAFAQRVKVMESITKKDYIKLREELDILRNKDTLRYIGSIKNFGI